MINFGVGVVAAGLAGVVLTRESFCCFVLSRTVALIRFAQRDEMTLLTQDTEDRYVGYCYDRWNLEPSDSTPKIPAVAVRGTLTDVQADTKRLYNRIISGVILG